MICRNKVLVEVTKWYCVIFVFCIVVVGVVKPGSHVGPGKLFIYNWQVLEGPSPSDSPCIPYLYYSATDPTMDTNSGLVGPLLVCKKGTLGATGTQVVETSKELIKLIKLTNFVLVNCCISLVARSKGLHTVLLFGTNA